MEFGGGGDDDIERRLSECAQQISELRSLIVQQRTRLHSETAAESAVDHGVRGHAGPQASYDVYTESKTGGHEVYLCPYTHPHSHLHTTLHLDSENDGDAEALLYPTGPFIGGCGL
jgi:hypothetical protein